MQTINDKWKYRLQQLFEMLSLSLDTSLESLSPLVNSPVNDGQFEVSRDLNHTVGTQPISSFSNAINPHLSVDAFCEKSFTTICFS